MPDRPAHPRYSFIVEIAGLEMNDFIRVDLPSVAAPPIELREGNDVSLGPRKIPGTIEVGELLLERLYDGDHSLFEWMKSVADGVDDRRSVSVKILDRGREEVARWNLFETWPVLYDGPTLDANGNELATEVVVLATERIEPA